MGSSGSRLRLWLCDLGLSGGEVIEDDVGRVEEVLADAKEEDAEEMVAVDDVDAEAEPEVEGNTELEADADPAREYVFVNSSSPLQSSGKIISVV